MTTFFGILTKVGEAKEANAKALGVPVLITELEVGDGGGISPTPDREQTALIGPKRRAQINRSFVDPNNPAWLVIEQVIPEQFGGWWIRELGVRDADGDLIAVANCPPTYKPQLAEGSARTQVVRMVLQVSSSKDFTLKVDPSVVLATRTYVDDEVAKRLGKNDTAAAATKLATARKISASGAAKAEPKEFDGTKDLDLVLSELDMDKAAKGTLALSRGGTGLASVPDGHLMVGTAAGPLRTATPVSLLAGAFPRIFSILELPPENLGPILVAECAEVWLWAKTQYFSGYRSPLCGRPMDGHTIAPLPNEVDAVGGVVTKSAYPGLWGYAQENGLVVSQTVWTANRGGHFFVDVDATNFRLPDLRDMFRRFTGTDADTANARAVGSRQLDAMQGHWHEARTAALGGGATNNLGRDNGGGIANGMVRKPISDGVNGEPRTSVETRAVNVAYHPRIHA